MKINKVKLGRTPEAPISRREKIHTKAMAVLSAIVRHGILITVAFSCIFPLVWMFSSALKTQRTVFSDMGIIPDDPHFSNFVTAWTEGNFGSYFINSVIYTAGVVIGVLLIASLAAYAFARLRFPGKNLLYYMFLATIMIPVPGAIVAIYVLIMKLGLINTRLGYILPQINGSLAVGLFILKPFFERIPVELEDAARIDGCGRFGIWWNVLIPLAKPALAVVALFTSITVWNEFILAQLILQDQALMPLTKGLLTFWGGQLAQDHLLMAGATITVIPIIIAYTFLQKHIIAGATAGAVKG